MNLNKHELDQNETVSTLGFRFFTRVTSLCALNGVLQLDVSWTCCSFFTEFLWRCAAWNLLLAVAYASLFQLETRLKFDPSVLLCERCRRARGPQPREPFQRPQRQKCCGALLLCGEPPTPVADGGFLLHTCPAIKRLSKTHARDACTPTLPRAQLCSKLDLFGILSESEALESSFFPVLALALLRGDGALLPPFAHALPGRRALGGFWFCVWRLGVSAGGPAAQQSPPRRLIICHVCFLLIWIFVLKERSHCLCSTLLYPVFFFLFTCKMI